MRKTAKVLLGIMFVGVIGGCAKLAPVQGRSFYESWGGKADTTQTRPDRMLVRTAELTIQVRSVSQAIGKATSIAESHGGFVERTADRGEESANVLLRVPAETFKAAMTGFEALGKVTSRNVKEEDVTEQCIDMEAILKNKIALRDRMKQLLDKTADMKDIIAIEEQLNRLQTDIDSMEGKMRSIGRQVEYARVDVCLERKPIFGPLGYLVRGFFWGIEKMFVIRD